MPIENKQQQNEKLTKNVPNFAKSTKIYVFWIKMSKAHPPELKKYMDKKVIDLCAYFMTALLP